MLIAYAFPVVVREELRRLSVVAWGALALVVAGCSVGAPVEAISAARSGLERSVPGIEVRGVSEVAVDGDCALVEFDTSRGIDNVGAHRDAQGSWSVRKVATDADYFDLDYSDWPSRACR
ncbi:hypothetical protein [Lapillicoccus sp.]|uniref:hypothetical protein n=1 Tax=Lapillicoccus sp. TaxID=1909287 RepID=UPI0025DB034F|nr:hypothetical protein [Lapillicoccus sp.]